MADSLARPTPSLLAAPDVYDRARWEAAVLVGDLPYTARLLALLLAHLAGTRGELPAGGPHNADRLAHLARLPRKQTRISLGALERAGHFRRPSIHTWEERDVLRPITLTMPSAAIRQEPPHPGEAS